MMSASFSTATFLSWPNSCLATLRLFAVVLLRYAETAVYVLFPSFGDLLNLAFKQKVFQVEGVLHRRAVDFFLDLHTFGFKILVI